MQDNYLSTTLLLIVLLTLLNTCELVAQRQVMKLMQAW